MLCFMNVDNIGSFVVQMKELDRDVPAARVSLLLFLYPKWMSPSEESTAKQQIIGLMDNQPSEESTAKQQIIGLMDNHRTPTEALVFIGYLILYSSIQHPSILRDT